MNGKLLLDTNIILGIFRGTPSIARVLEAHAGADMYVSVLTKMEFLSFHSLTPEEEAFIVDLLGDVTEALINGLFALWPRQTHPVRSSCMS